MSNAFLSATEFYLPENKLTNAIINQEFPEWSVDKIMSKVGISQRSISEPNEFVSDLAVKAANNLLKINAIDRKSIDYLILCTQSPDYFLPTTACLVHEQLGLKNTAGAIDINQGCSGFIYGLSLAKGLIASGDFENVLLITAETYSKFLHPEDKGNRSIFGDAAAATLISSNGKGKIGRVVVGTDGKGAENLIVKNGAAKSPKTIETRLKEDEHGNLRNDNFLFMNGSEIFNFTIQAVPALIKQVLSAHNFSLEDIDLFIFHQANTFMLEHLRKKTKIPKEKFIIHMEDCGNTVSSTIPIVIKHALETGKIQEGNKVLIAGFGVGYSWGGTVLTF